MSIYLASRSPRRRELLQQIGVRYEPLLFREGQRADPDTDESVRPGEDPDAYVRRVTVMKANAAWSRVTMRRGLQRKPVLVADTTVASDKKTGDLWVAFIRTDPGFDVRFDLTLEVKGAGTWVWKGINGEMEYKVAAKGPDKVK